MISRKTIPIFLFLFCCISAFSQIQLLPLTNETFRLPTMDNLQLTAEAEMAEDDVFSFAKAIKVNLSPATSGKTKHLSDSTALWTQRIESPNAISLNLIFSSFRLTKGDSLFIIANDGEDIFGPLTDKDNLQSGIYPTRLFHADNLTIYYKYNSKTQKNNLVVGQINHGFRGFPQPNSLSGDECSLYADLSGITDEAYEKARRSVAILMINGTVSCTGVLVNNAENLDRPYLLTAAHCFLNDNSFDESYIPTMVAYFNYESPLGNPDIKGSFEFTSHSPTLKAYAVDMDMTLVELSSALPKDYRPIYSGWNLATNPSSPYYGIHHPNSSTKRVTIDNGTLSTISYSNMISNAHFQVNGWETGTTQPGSSGSPLFDKDFRLLGCLTGGNSECSNSLSDQYYKLNRVWDYYIAQDKQLKNWLNPSNLPISTCDFRNPYTEFEAYRKKSISSASDVIALTLKDGFLPTAYAQEFSLNEESELLGVYLPTAIAPLPTTIKVYQNGLTDDDLIHTQSVGTLTMPNWSGGIFNPTYEKSNTQKKNADNYIRFSSPIIVSNQFYIVYETTNNFTPYMRKEDTTNESLAFVNGEWLPLSECTNGYTKLWIDAVIAKKEKSSGITKNQHTQTQKLRIIPNPIKQNEQLTLILPSVDDQAQHIVQLYSIWGQKIYSTTCQFINSQTQLTLPTLPTGIYLIRIDDCLGFEKIIIH
jgi:hypothetical protein